MKRLTQHEGLQNERLLRTSMAVAIGLVAVMIAREIGRKPLWRAVATGVGVASTALTAVRGLQAEPLSNSYVANEVYDGSQTDRGVTLTSRLTSAGEE